MIGGRLIAILVSVWMFALAATGAWAPAAVAATVSPGAAGSPAAAGLFERQCAGCHINGGNIIRRNKTLRLKALQQNQVATVAAIADLITHGKGNLMSAYGDRLSSEEITSLATYVLDQAEHDWP